MPFRHMAAGLLAVLLLSPLAGNAATDFGDGVRYVFVTALHGTEISVIDSRDDSVAGHMDLGLVPSQLEMAGDLGRLVAMDGVSPRVAVASTQSGKTTLIALEFVPTRLSMSADGARVIAAAPDAGRLAVVDVAAARVAGQGRTEPFRDFLIIGGGDQALLAPQAGEGLVVYDLRHWQVAAEVAPPRPGLGGFSALSRSPSGRIVYARAAAAPVVVAVDVAAANVVGEVGTGGAKPYTNATGITLILPDSSERSVALVPSSLRGRSALAGEAGMNGVYSGWFDTVAFIPSTASKAVVVVDQQGRFRGDDIVLGATPGRGTVTPDGRKLYLPLIDANRVAVIDAERRKLVRYVTLPNAPAIALMARTFGLCH